jgi:hypothetical protein
MILRNLLRRSVLLPAIGLVAACGPGAGPPAGDAAGEPAGDGAPHAVATDTPAHGAAALPAADLDAVWRAAPPFAAFVDGVTSRAADWRRAYDAATVREDFEARASVLPGAYRLLAIVEDDCVDCIGAVPPIARLAERVPSAELRVARGADAPGVVARYASGGVERALPLVLVLDASGRETGCWLGGRGESLEWYRRDRGNAVLSAVVERLEAARHGERICG